MMRARLTILVVATMITVAFPAAERMGYPPEEFAARRQQLATAFS